MYLTVLYLTVMYTFCACLGPIPCLYAPGKRQAQAETWYFCMTDQATSQPTNPPTSPQIKIRTAGTPSGGGANSRLPPLDPSAPSAGARCHISGPYGLFSTRGGAGASPGRAGRAASAGGAAEGAHCAWFFFAGLIAAGAGCLANARLASLCHWRCVPLPSEEIRTAAINTLPPGSSLSPLFATCRQYHPHRAAACGKDAPRATQAGGRNLRTSASSR